MYNSLPTKRDNHYAKIKIKSVYSLAKNNDSKVRIIL
ncbi:hypothetical protein CLV00_2549 [Flavobacterium sp. 11]|jgi:hypothetical protein|nr:hypothetical protein CLV00_2549 [Flavobacterium sp. 11]